MIAWYRYAPLFYWRPMSTLLNPINGSLVEDRLTTDLRNISISPEFIGIVGDSKSSIPFCVPDDITTTIPVVHSELFHNLNAVYKLDQDGYFDIAVGRVIALDYETASNMVNLTYLCEHNYFNRTAKIIYSTDDRTPYEIAFANIYVQYIST